jgi:predicted nucleic acid-binding protein
MMILVDTSLWIETLRGRDNAATGRLRAAIAADPASIATTEPIVMELLAGAPGPRALDQISALVASMPLLPIDSARDFSDAAALFRTARSSGHTVRSLMDCLIAAIALRHNATLWHRDADYAAISSVAPLDCVDLR